MGGEFSDMKVDTHVPYGGVGDARINYNSGKHLAQHQPSSSMSKSSSTPALLALGNASADAVVVPAKSTSVHGLSDIDDSSPSLRAGGLPPLSPLSPGRTRTRLPPLQRSQSASGMTRPSPLAQVTNNSFEDQMSSTFLSVSEPSSPVRRSLRKWTCEYCSQPAIDVWKGGGLCKDCWRERNPNAGVAASFNRPMRMSGFSAKPLPLSGPHDKSGRAYTKKLAPPPSLC